jgi:hypothetical protein
MAVPVVGQDVIAGFGRAMRRVAIAVTAIASADANRRDGKP